MKSKKKHLKYLLIGVPTILVLWVVLFIFMVNRVENIEGYCADKAREVVKNDPNRDVPVTNADIRQAPTFKGSTKISWELSEELKCERGQKYFQ